MKRMFLIAALAVSAIAAAGCSGCAVTPRDPTNLTQTVVDEKALFAVEAGYAGIGAAAEAAVDNGLLKGSLAGQVNVYQKAAYQALLAARAAYKVGDAATYQAKIGAAQTFIAQAWALIPGKKET